MRKNNVKKKKNTTIKMQPRLWLDGLFAFIVVVLINVFVFGYFIKIDVTQDKRFSLSSVSREIIENIDGDFKIKYFTSKEYPQNMIPTVNAIEDALGEIEDLGGGNIKVEKLYPKDEEDAKKQAEDFQIKPLSFNVIEDDKTLTSEGYSGLTFLYRDRQISIPVIADEKGLEYEIISIVEKISSNSGDTVGIVSIGVSQRSTGFLGLINRQYDILNVSLEEVPDVDLLIVPGVSGDYSNEELYNLDQFILRKKKVVFLIDGHVIDQESFERSDLNTNVHKLLSSYGISVESGVVGDFESNERAVLNEEGGQVTQDYPLWIKLSSGIDRGHPITSGLRSFIMPWSSELHISAEEDVQLRLYSSDSSYAFTGDELKFVSPKSVYEPSRPQQSKKLIGIFTNGKKGSFFVEDGAFNAREGFISDAEDVELFVVGSSSMISNNFLRTNPENAGMILNAVDYMIDGESLAEVRNKTLIERSLESQAKKDNLMFSSIASTSILVFVIMALVFFWRRYLSNKAKKNYVQ